MALKDWSKYGMPNVWKHKKTKVFVHAFKGHNRGVPTGNWIVRVGKTDEDLLGNQKKFKNKKDALKFARDYMRKN